MTNKTLKFIHVYNLILFTSALIFTSCNEDDFLNSNGKVKFLTLKAGISEAMNAETRLSVENNNEYGLITKWENGDAINLYHDFLSNNVLPDNVIFKANNTGNDGKSYATFSPYQVDDYLSFDLSKKVYALYNPKGVDKSGSNSDSIPIDIKTNDFTVENLKNVDYLYGQLDADKLGTESMSFRHLIAVLKIDVRIDETNNKTLFNKIKKGNGNGNQSTDFKLTDIVIESKEGLEYEVLSNNALYNIKEDILNIKKSSSLLIYNKQGVNIEFYNGNANNKYFHFSTYIPLLPGSSTKDLSIKFTLKKNPTSTSLPESYIISSGMTLPEIKRGNYYYGTRNIGTDIEDNYINITEEGIIEFETLRELEYAIYQMNEEQLKSVMGIKLLGSELMSKYEEEHDPREVYNKDALPDNHPCKWDGCKCLDHKFDRFQKSGSGNEAISRKEAIMRFLNDIQKEGYTIWDRRLMKTGLSKAVSLDIKDYSNILMNNYTGSGGKLFGGNLKMIRISEINYVQNSDPNNYYDPCKAFQDYDSLCVLFIPKLITGTWNGLNNTPEKDFHLLIGTNYNKETTFYASEKHEKSWFSKTHLYLNNIDYRNVDNENMWGFYYTGGQKKLHTWKEINIIDTVEDEEKLWKNLYNKHVLMKENN